MIRILLLSVLLLSGCSKREEMIKWFSTTCETAESTTISIEMGEWGDKLILSCTGKLEPTDE